MDRRSVKQVLADNLTACMEARGIGNRRLADLAGVGEGTVARARNATVAVGIDNLEQIAAALGLSAWQLLVDGFTPESPPKLALTLDNIERIKALAEGLKQIVGH